MRTRKEPKEDHPFTGRTEFHRPTRGFDSKRNREDLDWKEELDELMYGDNEEYMT